MADYSVEMFHTDFEKVMPILARYQDLESLGEKKGEAKPENAVIEILTYFIEKYGNSKGTDYEMRFLAVMQFIEHYQNDFLVKGVVSDNQFLRISNELLGILLDSFKAPQPPSVCPSSSLFNQNHQFNYKKVMKSLKPNN